MTTPENITQLNKNQIFVFGSNLNGNHAGGAALQAKNDFGAEEGIGEGHTGQSYAFPTLDKDMQKVSMDALKTSRDTLYEYANNHKELQFLITKIGCGIAGFTEDEMKTVFTIDKPANVVLPKGWAKVYGYKAFDKGLMCRGFQYELGKDFYHEGQISPCNSGFHFCKSLSDVYSFYSFGNDIVVAEVESEGDVIDEEEKSVTNHIRITRILNAEQAANNSGSLNTGHSNTGDWNTGDWNTGHSNTGDWNTGHSNTGHSNTGDWNTGDWNTGHSNTGDWNTGDRNTGYFNFLSPSTVLVFEKECKYKDWVNSDKPNFIYFDTKKWISFEDMTDNEKSEFPSAKTCGGYYKILDYKEAFQKSYENASLSDRNKIKKLPNFDAEIFFKISGIKVDEVK